jgi:hypothetical protein
MKDCLPLTFEPVAFPGDRYDLRVVQQTIQQCRRQRGILGKGGIPLPERQLLVTIRLLLS